MSGVDVVQPVQLGAVASVGLLSENMIQTIGFSLSLECSTIYEVFYHLQCQRTQLWQVLDTNHSQTQVWVHGQEDSRCSSTLSCFRLFQLNRKQLRFIFDVSVPCPSIVWCAVRYAIPRTQVNGFSVVDEKLTRKRIKGDGEEILPAVSMRFAFFC